MIFLHGKMRIQNIKLKPSSLLNLFAQIFEEGALNDIFFRFKTRNIIKRKFETLLIRFYGERKSNNEIVDHNSSACRRLLIGVDTLQH